MIGVIVPAHNEERVIGRCIDALIRAAAHPGLGGEDVQIVVVMDACADDTAHVVSRHPVQGVVGHYANVGKARAVGAEHLLDRGARWLAFTDADSLVPYNWLVEQVNCGSDVVCGTVTVEDWSLHADEVRARYDALYQPIEGHRHIHGANLGVSALAYRGVGGFKPLTAHEDVNLVADLTGAGATITWTARNSVTTSARIDCRCREGFGDYLRSLVVAPNVEAGVEKTGWVAH
jgi:glycosyltransferase involved in cell wall biosynthesis